MATVNFDGLVSNPSTPAANRVKLFARNDVLFFMDDTGAVFSMAGGIGRVPVTDITDPSSELNALEGAAAADLIIAFEANVGADDVYTVYAWDPDPPGAENVPFTVDGLSAGRWIAIAGRFQNQSIESVKDENFIRFFFALFSLLPDPATFHGMFAHVHDPTNALQGGSAYYAHQGDNWRLLKDHNADDELTLTPAATVDINFGRTGSGTINYQILTLDQDTALTESNAIAGIVRTLRINSGTPGQTLAFPANWEVFGNYDESGAVNLIVVTCVSPSVVEIQAGSPPAAAYVANITTLTRGRGNSQTGLSDSATGLLTVNGSDPAHLDIADRQGQIENRTDLTNIFPDPVAWTGLTDITLPNIATTQFTNIYIVETAPGSGIGTFLLENTPLTASTGRTRIYLGTAIHQAGTVIEQLLIIPILSYDTASSLVDLFTQFGDQNSSGSNIYSANGANRLLNKSAGVVFGRQINITTNPLQPHSVVTASQVSITPYAYSRRDGVGGFTLSSELDIDPDFFDDGSGTLAAVPVGRFTHQPIHFDPRSGVTILEYGQTTYATQAEAIDGINQNDIIFNGLIGNIEITTWIVAPEGTGDLLSDAVFPEPLENPVSPSGVLSHDVLTDVTSDQHHAQVHTIVSHDTTATGANLDTLTDGSSTTLHTHPGIGGALIFVWDFSTNTSEADPGTGNFRMDNATPASVTRLYIDSVTSNGLNVDNFFNQLKVGEEIAVQQSDDPTKVILFETTAITDNSGWWRIDVTVESSTGALFQNNRQCVFVFHTGNAAISHDDLTNVTSDQHHPQLHAAAHAENAGDELFVENLGATSADVSTALRPDGTGGLTFTDVAHADLTSVTSDQHHPQLHASAHSENAADEIFVENLGATSADTSTALRPDGTGGLSFTDVAHTDLTGVTSDQHHPQLHAAAHEDGGGDELEVEDLATASTNDTQILQPDGSGGLVFNSPVKEVYQNIGYSSFKNSYRVRAVASNGSANISFAVPDDFVSLVSLELIAFSDGTVSGVDIDLESDYGAVGQSNTTHSETDTTTTYSFTVDITTATDISTVFASLSAGDKCGLFWDNNGIGTTLNMLGIRLIYNA